MAGDHAHLSPSGSSIWMNCPGQPEFSRGVEKAESSYMLRGTAAHDLLFHCAEHLADPAATPRNPNEAVAKPIGDKHGVVFDREDRIAVQEAVDWYRSEVEPGDEVELESKLVYSEELWGTCDFSRFRPSTGELLVADYKHGAGVAVDATDNPQGLIYATMRVKALGNRGASSVRFVIVQPRAFHADGPIREFVIDGVDMLDWEDRIVAAIKATQEARKGRLVLSAGKWCRWCAVGAICPANRAAGGSGGRPPASLEQGYDVLSLVGELDAVKAAEDRIKLVKAFAHAEAERGVKLPGWKLVAKRPSASWKNEDLVKGELELIHGLPLCKITEPLVLKSPAQIRAVLAEEMPGKTKKAREEAAKKILDDDYVVYESSGKSLVPDEDGRREVLTGPKSVFSNLDKQES